MQFGFNLLWNQQACGRDDRTEAHIPSRKSGEAHSLSTACTEAERDQAYPTPLAMAHDGPLLTQQPAQPPTPTTAQRNGAMGRRSRASGFDSPGGHLGHMDVRGGMNRVAGCPVTGGRPGTPPGIAAVRHPDRCIREVKGLPRGEEKPRIEFESRLAHSGGDLRRENMTTVKYVSLMRCQGGNSAWEDEDGERTVIAGKKPKTWMPRVIVETEDGREVIGVCYKREALAELPEWMNHEDAFKWARETVPEGFEEFYDGVEVEA